MSKIIEELEKDSKRQKHFETLREEYELKLSCYNLALQLNVKDSERVLNNAKEIYSWVTNNEK